MLDSGACIWKEWQRACESGRQTGKRYKSLLQGGARPAEKSVSIDETCSPLVSHMYSIFSFGCENWKWSQESMTRLKRWEHNDAPDFHAPNADLYFLTTAHAARDRPDRTRVPSRPRHLSPVHSCHMLQCQHRTCVRFRRSLKQNGVFQHTARSTHIGGGTGYCSFC